VDGVLISDHRKTSRYKGSKVPTAAIEVVVASDVSMPEAKRENEVVVTDSDSGRDDVVGLLIMIGMDAVEDP
jgi:hypothetical protein